MKQQKWEMWIKNRNALEKEFKHYLKRETIRKGATTIEIEGHLNKAKRNLRFSRRTLDDLKDFYTSYYAVYEAGLALCALKGYKTRNQIATIAILIKFFYPQHLSKEDLKTVAKTIMAEEDIRKLMNWEKSMHLIGPLLDQNIYYELAIAENLGALAESLGEKAIEFVNKVERIIRGE